MKSNVKKKGHYLGTEVNGRWWRRFTKEGFFARGNGEYWYDNKAFYFHKYLTKNPISIPFNKVLEIKTGKWHGGRWCMGIPVIKIIWKKDDLMLSSGFVISKNKNETVQLRLFLESKIGQVTL
jgi:hypothetical protein